MNPEQFRKLYDYHLAANRALWDRCLAPLPVEQFRQMLPYSVGSVRNQVVHLMNMEERWFCGLRGVAVPGILNPVYFGTQAAMCQVLSHVLNHDPDHRAQTLGLLAQLGVTGFAQNYYLYLRGRF